MLKEPKKIDENVRKSIFKTATKERAEKRFTWATNFDFSLVSMACVVGITNFVVFPQKCKQHGGMAFCVPYVIVVIFMGLPLYFLETLLGQYSGHGTIAIMNELVPAFVGIGYALVVNNFVEFMRNEVDSARLLYLSIVTMEPTIPWAICSASNSVACYTKADDLYCMDKFGNTSVFFNLTCTPISTICKTLHHVNSSGENCQQKNGSWVPYNKLIQRSTPEREFLYRHILNMEDATLSHLGPVHWPMFFCLAACWLMTYSLGYNGFSTTAKSAYLTVFAPLFGQFLIFLKAFSLDGADEGIRAYLTFDATSLSSKHVWIDAIKTCFSSLSLGLGLIIAIGSANKPYKNCLKTTVVVILLDTLVSLASGLGFFALIGHLAHTFHMTVEELLAGETDVMFTTLPLALTSLNFPRIYVVVCYTSATLVSFGYLTAVIAMTTYDGKDIFNSFTNRRGDQEKKASNLLIYQYNIITCTVGFTISIMFVVKGGSLVLEVTDVARHIDMSFIIASLQAIVICFFYGSGSLLDLVEDEMGITLGRLRPYWALSWNIVAPAALAILGHTLHGNSYVPFERQMAEGERIRRESARI
ncbi:sodium-dependent noradrenaline transporter-like [Pollicipes pollicipes]|uniref:sodium-dependent noradrenaline transporter-like n=1 Tax=Pollicipes pollicipes TaxID=41117 RepID=UPI00188544EA|nr:sodium-dependent noradrenaline transporter-like [Pollicipes pollicipes]